MPRSGDPVYGRSILQPTLHQELQGQLARLRQLLLAIWGGLVLIGLLPSLLIGEQPIQAAPLSRLAAYTPGGDDSVDLEVIKRVNSSLVYEGDTITYTITVTNKGPNLAADVYLIDTLPAEVTFDASTATQGSYASPGGLWEVGSIAKGASAILTITAGVNNGTACTTITNTASILNADQSNQPNHTGQATTAVACSPRSADLAVSKTVNKIAPDEGEVITYTIRVTNLGPNEATHVQLTDTLPTQLTYLPPYLTSQGHYHSNGVWTIGELAQQASATLTITAKINPGTACTPITNTARISTAALSDPNQANNIGQVAMNITCPPPSADLLVTKVVNNPAPDAGDVIIYTISVANSGPDNATGIQLTDPLPAGVSYISHSASHGNYTNDVWVVDDLVKNGMAVLRITAQVNPCTNGRLITNTAKILTVTPSDSNSDNNEASAAVNVTTAIPCYVYLPILIKNYQFCHLYDFSIQDGGWQNWEDSHTKFGYINDEFQVVAKNPSRTHMAFPQDKHENYNIRVKARWFDNVSIGEKYGLTFAIADDFSSFYTFMIYPNTQNYEIKYYNGSWNTLYSGYSSAISSGLAANHLWMERLNGTISITVNNISLVSIPATQISGMRYAGIGVGPYTPTGSSHIAEARFDDYQICPLDIGVTSFDLMNQADLQGGSVPGG